MHLRKRLILEVIALNTRLVKHINFLANILNEASCNKSTFCLLIVKILKKAN